MEQNFACRIVLRLESSHTKGQESCLKWNLTCRKLKMKEWVIWTLVYEILFLQKSEDLKRKAVVCLGARQAEPEKSTHGESRRVKGKSGKEQHVSPSGGLWSRSPCKSSPSLCRCTSPTGFRKNGWIIRQHGAWSSASWAENNMADD